MSCRDVYSISTKLLLSRLSRTLDLSKAFVSPLRSLNQVARRPEAPQARHGEPGKKSKEGNVWRFKDFMGYERREEVRGMDVPSCQEGAFRSCPKYAEERYFSYLCYCRLTGSLDSAMDFQRWMLFTEVTPGSYGNRTI